MIMGDIFSEISDSTIVSRSRVSDSFHRLEDRSSKEAAEALVRLAEIVANSGKAEAGEMLDAFCEEISKPKPRKSVLRNYWDGIVKIVPDITKMAESFSKLTSIFMG